MKVYKYKIKKNAVKHKYNCFYCNKMMDIDLFECLHCSNKFNQKMTKLHRSSTDPAINPHHKAPEIAKDLQNEIIKYYYYLKKEEIADSKRGALSYINKKFDLKIPYWQLFKILSGS
jgi:hypothetical protein